MHSDNEKEPGCQAADSDASAAASEIRAECVQAPLHPMDGSAFGRTRAALGLSQKALALALGVSSKAVESYEQGWRPVPDQVERKLYYLLFRLTLPADGGIEPCWSTIGCAESARSACIAARAGEGTYCWFIAGRTCASAGAAGADPRYCYSCEAFLRLAALSGLIDRPNAAGLIGSRHASS